MRLVLVSFPGDGSLRARPTKDCLEKGLSASRERRVPVKMFNEVFFYTIRDRSSFFFFVSLSIKVLLSSRRTLFRDDG